LQAGWRQVAGLDATAVTDTVKEQQVGFLADYLYVMAFSLRFR
jgi:hypothetical protein